MSIVSRLLTSGKAAALGAGTLIVGQVVAQAHEDPSKILTKGFGIRLGVTVLAAAWQSVACPVGSLHARLTASDAGPGVPAFDPAARAALDAPPNTDAASARAATAALPAAQQGL